jgi:dihydroorotate dehydrogenase electron transfer subunit
MPRRFDHTYEIVSNRQVAPETFLLQVAAPEFAGQAIPGQFAMLRAAGDAVFDPLLRRPLSIHRVNREQTRADFLYRVVGKGTMLLSKRRPGHHLRILGPLGRGFHVQEGAIPVLVGGGLGVAPLLFLADMLRGQRGIICLGAITRGQILRLDAFTRTGLELLIATEDGSLGTRGLVTEVLDRMLAGLDRQDRKRIQILACGPVPMLKAVVRLSTHYDCPCQVSLEAFMACGSGLCLGCAVPASSGDGYLHVCKEGPVFDASRIDWERI